MPLLFFTQAAAPPESVLLELSHGLELMLLPISDEVPLLLQRLSHPETPELRQLGIGEHVGHDQEQRATPWTTPLFSAAEVPLTVWRARSKRCEPWLRKSARMLCGTSRWPPHECEEASPRLPTQVMVTLSLESWARGVSNKTPWRGSLERRTSFSPSGGGKRT